MHSLDRLAGAERARRCGVEDRIRVDRIRNSVWEMTAMNLSTVVNRFVRDEQGQDLIEYALLATFVSLVAIIGATALGKALNNWYTKVADNVNGAAASAS
jgi:pilus assembly protein Flp/PilA